MSDFLKVTPIEKALKIIDEHPSALPPTVNVNTVDSISRTISKPIKSSSNLPNFERSTMDGYAVRASDTYGASQSQPSYLHVVSEIKMGSTPNTRLNTGEASRIFTGGMIPESADAVVMVEYTELIDQSLIEIIKPVAPGENIIQIGEDIKENDIIFEVGHKIRPQDIGGLLALGITQIPVFQPPKIGVISTGDELIDPKTEPIKGQVRDINSYTISSLIQKHGGEPIIFGINKDEFEIQFETAKKALSKCSIVVISAGSSTSSRDLTSKVISNLGKPGILMHGLAHKPGKPSIIGSARDKLIFGLHGNPVSAMIIFQLLVKKAINNILRRTQEIINPSKAILTTDIPSINGREEHVPVKLFNSQSGTLMAQPVFGKSNLIYTLIRSDGIVVVPINKSGVYSGDLVDVFIN